MKKKTEVSHIQNCPREDCVRKDKLIVFLREKCVSIEKDCIRKDGVIEYLMEKCESLEQRIIYSYSNGLIDQKGCKIIPLDPNYENIKAILTNFKPYDRN